MPKIISKITLLLTAVICMAFVAVNHDNFPVPTGVKNMLFYVQRTMNKNTLIYQLNVNANNELNEKEPIHIYWINYSDKNSIEELNYIQRKYAYGLVTSKIDSVKKTFSLQFVSYKKQVLYLIKAPDKKYHVFSYFNNQLLQITSIYVHIEGGSFWTPKVKYIEVKGKDLVKNEERTEKIII